MLVIEMTEHAYTGDSGLQRFVRVAAAAEARVPFIYSAPLARVRDDEMDRVDDFSLLSKRSLTSGFFEGMAALHEAYGTPQLYAEWITALNGKVRKMPANAPFEALRDVYGEVVGLSDAVLSTQTGTGEDVDEARAIVCGAQERLLALAQRRTRSPVMCAST